MKRSHEDLDGVLTFGKHKGKTYERVMKNDQGYCNWVLSQPGSSDHLVHFQLYLSVHKGMQVNANANIFDGTVEWTPRHHFLYPVCFRKSIRIFLLCLKKNQLWLPKDVLYLIIREVILKTNVGEYLVGFGQHAQSPYNYVKPSYVKWIRSIKRDELHSRAMLNFFDYCALVDDD